MITLDGVEYHLIKVEENSCEPPGFPACCLRHKFDLERGCPIEQMKFCSPPRGAPHPAIFLTRDEYLAHIARKFTS